LKAEDKLPDGHLIIDIGPGISSVLLALIVAVPGIVAAIYGRSNSAAIAKANSHLAVALAVNANPAGEAKLTIAPMPTQPVKDA